MDTVDDVVEKTLCVDIAEIFRKKEKSTRSLIRQAMSKWSVNLSLGERRQLTDQIEELIMLRLKSEFVCSVCEQNLNLIVLYDKTNNKISIGQHRMKGFLKDMDWGDLTEKKIVRNIETFVDTLLESGVFYGVGSIKQARGRK